MAVGLEPTPVRFAQTAQSSANASLQLPTAWKHLEYGERCWLTLVFMASAWKLSSQRPAAASDCGLPKATVFSLCWHVSVCSRRDYTVY